MLKKIAVIAIVIVAITPSAFATTNQSGSYTLTCEKGDSYEVMYQISNGKVNGMSVKLGSLLIQIDASDKGTISLDIPRQLIDQKIYEQQDDEFFILINGEEVRKGEYQETTESPNTKSRTLIIPFSAGNNLGIEIITSGTPESMQFAKSCIGVESTWKIQNVTRDGQVFKVPYKITTGTVEKIAYDDFGAFVIQISNENNGIIEITIPRNLFDQKLIVSLSPDEVLAGKTIKRQDMKDDQFFILIDGEEIHYKETSQSSCFRTVMFEFPLGAREIEFVTTWAGSQRPIDSTPVLPVYVTTDKGNYEHGETITISGCTDLAIDYDKVNLEILNPEGKTYDIVTVTPNIDGTFSYSFIPEGALGVDGTYTVNTNYGDNSVSSTFIVPEFPIPLFVLLVSLIAIIFAAKPRNLNSAHFP